MAAVGPQLNVTLTRINGPPKGTNKYNKRSRGHVFVGVCVCVCVCVCECVYECVCVYCFALYVWCLVALRLCLCFCYTVRAVQLAFHCVNGVGNVLHCFVFYCASIRDPSVVPSFISVSNVTNISSLTRMFRPTGLHVRMSVVQAQHFREWSGMGLRLMLFAADTTPHCTAPHHTRRHHSTPRHTTPHHTTAHPTGSIEIPH